MSNSYAHKRKPKRITTEIGEKEKDKQIERNVAGNTVYFYNVCVEPFIRNGGRGIFVFRGVTLDKIM